MRSHSRTLFPVAVFAAALAFAACRNAGPVAPPDDVDGPRYHVIAYATGRTNFERLDVAPLTHVNFSFAHVSDSGEVVFSRPGTEERLRALLARRADNPRLKVLVSVGGWGADGFSDAAFTPASRDRFARSAAAFVERYDLDGLDLDWEYPGLPGPGIKFRPEDKQNFTLMLAAVRAAFDAVAARRGRPVLLTIASSGSAGYFAHTEMDRVHRYLDFINVMTYDMYGGGSRNTGHHTGLFMSKAPGADALRTAEAYISRHLAAGIPASKIVLGAAFYGRGWTGVDTTNHGLFRPAERYRGDFSYSQLAAEYINRNGFERRWDPDARAPYLWSADSTTFIAFDDPESLRAKAAYVRQRGLGGLMWWEQAHDPDNVLLRVAAEALR